MPNPSIEVVEPTSDLDEQRAKISKIVTEYLPELIKKFVEADVSPYIVSIVMASESGVYANSILKKYLFPSGSSDTIAKDLSMLMREHVLSLGTLEGCADPSSEEPKS